MAQRNIELSLLCLNESLAFLDCNLYICFTGGDEWGGNRREGGIRVVKIEPV